MNAAPVGVKRTCADIEWGGVALVTASSLDGVMRCGRGAGALVRILAGPGSR